MLDRDSLADLIESGRLRQASSVDIADEIMARLADPAWAKAMTHPLRGEILQLLRAKGPMSPVRANEHLGDTATLGTLAYHFRTLLRLGLIVEERQIQRRGAVEHVYRLATNDHAA